MWRGHWWIPVLRAAKHSAGGAEERKPPQPERIDGPRRAHRQLRLFKLVSTWTLMKALHQKKTGYLSKENLLFLKRTKASPGVQLLVTLLPSRNSLVPAAFAL